MRQNNASTRIWRKREFLRASPAAHDSRETKGGPEEKSPGSSSQENQPPKIPPPSRLQPQAACFEPSLQPKAVSSRSEGLAAAQTGEQEILSIQDRNQSQPYSGNTPVTWILGNFSMNGSSGTWYPPKPAMGSTINEYVQEEQDDLLVYASRDAIKRSGIIAYEFPGQMDQPFWPRHLQPQDSLPFRPRDFGGEYLPLQPYTPMCTAQTISQIQAWPAQAGGFVPPPKSPDTADASPPGRQRNWHPQLVPSNKQWQKLSPYRGPIAIPTPTPTVPMPMPMPMPMQSYGPGQFAQERYQNQLWPIQGRPHVPLPWNQNLVAGVGPSPSYSHGSVRPLETQPQSQVPSNTVSFVDLPEGRFTTSPHLQQQDNLTQGLYQIAYREIILDPKYISIELKFWLGYPTDFNPGVGTYSVDKLWVLLVNPNTKLTDIFKVYWARYNIPANMQDFHFWFESLSFGFSGRRVPGKRYHYGESGEATKRRVCDTLWFKGNEFYLVGMDKAGRWRSPEK